MLMQTYEEALYITLCGVLTLLSIMAISSTLIRYRHFSEPSLKLYIHIVCYTGLSRSVIIFTDVIMEQYGDTNFINVLQNLQIGVLTISFSVPCMFAFCLYNFHEGNHELGRTRKIFFIGCMTSLFIGVGFCILHDLAVVDTGGRRQVFVILTITSLLIYVFVMLSFSFYFYMKIYRLILTISVSQTFKKEIRKLFLFPFLIFFAMTWPIIGYIANLLYKNSSATYYLILISKAVMSSLGILDGWCYQIKNSADGTSSIITTLTIQSLTTVKDDADSEIYFSQEKISSKSLINSSQKQIIITSEKLASLNENSIRSQYKSSIK